MIHETKVHRLGPSHYKMTCTCGEKQESMGVTEHDAEGWGMAHLHRVKYVLLNHGPRRPSIKTLRKYYEEQAANLNNTVAERKLWKQMSDELKRYFDNQSVDDDQLPLF